MFFVTKYDEETALLSFGSSHFTDVADVSSMRCMKWRIQLTNALCPFSGAVCVTFGFFKFIDRYMPRNTLMCM